MTRLGWDVTVVTPSSFRPAAVEGDTMGSSVRDSLLTQQSSISWSMVTQISDMENFSEHYGTLVSSSQGDTHSLVSGI